MLLSLAVQGMIPAGFMPGQPRSGTMQIVICTGMGSSTITVNEKTGLPDKSQKEKTSSAACPFTPVLPGFVSLNLPQIIAPHFEEIKQLEPVQVSINHISSKSWSSRGPPTILMHG